MKQTNRTRGVVAVSAASVLGLMACACVSPAALAAPANYDEAVSGDLGSSTQPPSVTLAFDIGNNVITGTTGFNAGVGETDSFGFTVPAGVWITSAQVAMSDLDGQIVSASYILSVKTPGPGELELKRFSVLSPGSTTITPNSPFPPFLAQGDYLLFQEGIARMGASTAHASYTFTFVGQAVPEPATAGMLMLAGAGPLLLGRRRQRSARA